MTAFGTSSSNPPQVGATRAGRALVNAAGPWVNRVGDVVVAAQPAAQVRLVKGSHIVVPRIAGANDAYLCQSGDGRVVFAIPYEERFTLIGTTEVPYTGDPAGSGDFRRTSKTICSTWRGQFFAKRADACGHRVELCRRASALRRRQRATLRR